MTRFCRSSTALEVFGWFWTTHSGIKGKWKKYFKNAFTYLRSFFSFKNVLIVAIKTKLCKAFIVVNYSYAYGCHTAIDQQTEYKKLRIFVLRFIYGVCIFDYIRSHGCGWICLTDMCYIVVFKTPPYLRNKMLLCTLLQMQVFY